MSAANVNAASRLAMLAERIAKLHAQIGREVLVTRGRRALTETSSDFERGLREVAGAVQSPELRENYRLLGLLWEEYRPAAMQQPTAETARKLSERAEEVAWVSHKGARLLHEQGRTRASELVLAAGSARAAAQRLARLHLQRGWSQPGGAAPRQVKLAESEVLLAFEQMKNAPESRDEVVTSLRMAENQWAFLAQAVERLDQGKERATQLEHIAKSADHIAETMDAVAKRYESLPRG